MKPNRPPVDFKSLPEDVRFIITSAAASYGLKPRDILSTSAKKIVSMARQDAIMAVRNLGIYSYPEIGRFFSRSHPSCIYAVQKANVRLAA